MVIAEALTPYERRPHGVLLLWCFGMAAMLLAIGVGATMASPPSSSLLIGVAVNSALLAIAVSAGAAAASRCDLTSLIVRAIPPTSAPPRDLIRFAIAGLLLGAAIAGVDMLLFAHVPSLTALLDKHADFTRTATTITPGAVIVRLAYGGVVEEILMRWCILSLLIWGLLTLRVRRSLAVGIAVMASALLFGALHLPATFQAFSEPPIAMLVRVVALNSLVGIVFGLAYARRSLEAAMACHAATHIGLLLSSTTAL